VRIWKGPGDRHPVRFTNLPDRCVALHVLDDGTVLAVMKDPFAFPVVLSLKPGRPPRKLMTLRAPSADPHPVAFSPAGRYLATTSQQSVVLVWRLW